MKVGSLDKDIATKKTKDMYIYIDRDYEGWTLFDMFCLTQTHLSICTLSLQTCRCTCICWIIILLLSLLNASSLGVSFLVLSSVVFRIFSQSLCLLTSFHPLHMPWFQHLHLILSSKACRILVGHIKSWDLVCVCIYSKVCTCMYVSFLKLR